MASVSFVFSLKKFWFEIDDFWSCRTRFANSAESKICNSNEFLRTIDFAQPWSGGALFVLFQIDICAFALGCGIKFLEYDSKTPCPFLLAKDASRVGFGIFIYYEPKRCSILLFRGTFRIEMCSSYNLFGSYSTPRTMLCQDLWHRWEEQFFHRIDWSLGVGIEKWALTPWFHFFLKKFKQLFPHVPPCVSLPTTYYPMKQSNLYYDRKKCNASVECWYGSSKKMQRNNRGLIIMGDPVRLMQVDMTARVFNSRYVCTRSAKSMSVSTS